MKILDIIKKGFEITTKNMKLVLVVFGSSLVLILIFSLISVPFTPQTAPGAPVTVSVPLAIINLVLFLALIVIQAGVLGSVKDALKEGTVQLNKFVGHCKKFYLRMWGLLGLIMVMVWIAAFIATVIVGLTLPGGNTFAIVIASLVALVIGAFAVYLALLLIFAPYIMVSDDIGVIESMKKSVALVRSKIKKILGLVPLLIIPFLVNWAVNQVSLFLSGIIPEGILLAILGVLYIVVFGALAYLNIAINSTFMVCLTDLRTGGSSQAPQA